MPGGPAGGPGDGDGRRVAVVAAIVAVLVALSFGLAAATGADTRDTDGGGLAGAGPEGATGDLADLQLPGPDGGAGGAGGTDTGDATGGGQTMPTPTPTAPTSPPPDPTLEAFRAVNSGDCLATWMTGETTWASDVPEVVPCDADNAGVWVSQTSDSTTTCPTDNARWFLSYTSGTETVVLCVTRQFEVGQCFLGMSDGSANLMSWVDCDNGTVPAPYSQVYNVTGVYQAPATVEGTECRQSANDQNEYWWWTIDGDTVLLCAVVYR